MIDYKYKYLKYKKKYQKAGAYGNSFRYTSVPRYISQLQNITEVRPQQHFKKYNTTINICGGCSFKQYKFGNRLITLIGENHDSDFIQNKTQLKKNKSNDISVADYVLKVLDCNQKAKVVLENDVYTPFILKINRGSNALTQIPLFLNGKDMCNRSTNIDWRCYFIRSNFIQKIYHSVLKNDDDTYIHPEELKLYTLPNNLKNFIDEQIKNPVPSSCSVLQRGCDSDKITEGILSDTSIELLNELEEEIQFCDSRIQELIEEYTILYEKDELTDKFIQDMQTLMIECLNYILDYFCLRELLLDNEHDEIIAVTGDDHTSIISAFLKTHKDIEELISIEIERSSHKDSTQCISLNNTYYLINSGYNQ